MVSASNNNVADVNKTTEKVEKTPAVKETQKIIADNDFDPALIKSAKENIPIIQETAQVYLSECRNVKSYSDYQIYSIAMSVYSEQIIKNTEQLNAILTVLEINGYDEHPEVGPLIEETRGMYLELSQCIDGLIDKYER